jgi:hypothetical protein
MRYTSRIKYVFLEFSTKELFSFSLVHDASSYFKIEVQYLKIHHRESRSFYVSTFIQMQHIFLFILCRIQDLSNLRNRLHTKYRSILQHIDEHAKHGIDKIKNH